MNFKERLLKQNKTGKLWGALKNLATQMAAYANMLSLALIAITAFHTTISPYLRSSRNIDMALWQFLLLIAVALMLVGLFEYKVSLPSFFSFWNSQFYSHGNQLRVDIEELKKKLDALETKIDAKS